MMAHHHPEEAEAEAISRQEAEAKAEAEAVAEALSQGQWQRQRQGQRQRRKQWRRQRQRRRRRRRQGYLWRLVEICGDFWSYEGRYGGFVEIGGDWWRLVEILWRFCGDFAEILWRQWLGRWQWRGGTRRDRRRRWPEVRQVRRAEADARAEAERRLRQAANIMQPSPFSSQVGRLALAAPASCTGPQ